MATRTRPKTLSASRRKRRPQLECLEEKQLLSITFGAYSSGQTWAFNDQAGWRQINPTIPVAMKEGTDGTLFASYTSGPHQGTQRYDYSTNQWTQLTGAVASVLSASQSDDTLFATFSGQGTWEESNGLWHQLASHDATMLAAVSDGNVYAVFSGDKTGTWSSNGGWHQLNTFVPIAMDASPDGALYASYFGFYGYPEGTWQYAGYSTLFWTGWSRETGDVATQIAAVSSTDFYMTSADGTFEVSAGTYFYSPFAPQDLFGFAVELTPDVATHLGHSGSTMIGSFNDSTTRIGNFNTIQNTSIDQRLTTIDWGNPAIQFG
jgi:hypothetical protein